jgi:hypothetical protein
MAQAQPALRVNKYRTVRGTVTAGNPECRVRARDGWESLWKWRHGIELLV